jgi:hypothetical protein
MNGMLIKLQGIYMIVAKKANDGVESYFKRIANKLRSIFNELGVEITKRFELNPVFADYADTLVKKI